MADADLDLFKEALMIAGTLHVLLPAASAPLGRALREIADASCASMLTQPGLTELALDAKAATIRLHDLADALDPPA